MSKELEFDGWWEGNVVYSCDNTGCRVHKRFRFDSEEETNSKKHYEELRNNGWITTKVNGQWKDFCCESCRNKYIRTQTI